MSWKTIYVAGRKDFAEEVVRNLERSGIEFMSGYHTRENNANTHELFWVPEAMAIRDFKLAVGAKAVLRFRLKFATSLEALVGTIGSDELTAEEQSRVDRMRRTDRAA
jgi:hypothetical protein